MNFGAQANAAEMLRLAAIGARRRGVTICATVHDALLIESSISQIEKVAVKAREAMDEASRTILDGYVLGVAAKFTRWPGRFFDEDGADFWENGIKPYLLK